MDKNPNTEELLAALRRVISGRDTSEQKLHEAVDYAIFVVGKHEAAIASAEQAHAAKDSPTLQALIDELRAEAHFGESAIETGALMQRAADTLAALSRGEAAGPYPDDGGLRPQVRPYEDAPSAFAVMKEHFFPEAPTHHHEAGGALGREEDGGHWRYHLEPVRDANHALHLLDDVESLVRFCAVNMPAGERYYRGAEALWRVVYWIARERDARSDDAQEGALGRNDEEALERVMQAFLKSFPSDVEPNDETAGQITFRQAALVRRLIRDVTRLRRDLAWTIKASKVFTPCEPDAEAPSGAPGREAVRDLIESVFYADCLDVNASPQECKDFRAKVELLTDRIAGRLSRPAPADQQGREQVIGELCEALEPFAAYAEHQEQFVWENAPDNLVWLGSLNAPTPAVFVGDFRRTVAALSRARSAVK